MSAPLRLNGASRGGQSIHDWLSALKEAGLDTIPGSRLIVTHESGHNVAQEQPELVVATIRQVVDEVTRRSPR